MNKADAQVLRKLRDNTGSDQKWAAYQNSAMDSADFGHLQFLKVGTGCTFAEPPERLPDTPTAINWRYTFIGYVDLDTGKVVA